MKAKKGRRKGTFVPRVLNEEKIARKLEMLKEVDDRRAVVAENYIRGKSPAQIARALNIPLDSIKEDLKQIRKDWIGQATQEIMALRAEEYARLLRQQDDAEESFKRSLEPKTVSRATRDGPGGQPVTSVVTFKRDGDPRWKAIILKCIEMRIKLLNLNLEPDEQQMAALLVTVPHTKILYDLPPPIKQVANESA